MKKIIIYITTFVLLVGLGFGTYIFIKDKKISSELSQVQKSEEVQNQEQKTDSQKEFASSITINRALGAWAVTSTGEYTIDPTSLSFEFTGYKPGGQHTGTFQTLNATVGLDAAGQPIQADIILEIPSIKTDAAGLDTHLQNKDFFDVESMGSQIKISITDVQAETLTTAKAITAITIKGVTKTVAIPLTVSRTDSGVKFVVDTTIKISDFNIAYGPVKDEVRINVSGEMKKK